MTRCILVSAAATVAILLARCGAPTPSWIPPHYLHEDFRTEDGRFLTIAWPDSPDAGEARPLAFLVHGGGWTGGRPDEMLPVADLVHELGYQPVLVQYRRLGEVESLDSSIVDLRSAWRHVSGRAEAIGGSVKGSVAIGGSAGGHLALWAFGSSESGAERPDSLLLLCPVLDTSPITGFGADRFGEDWRRWSPRHSTIRFTSATLVLHGSEDAVVTRSATSQAVEAMVTAGSNVDLAVIEGLPHGFYSRPDELAQARGLIERWCRLEVPP